MEGKLLVAGQHRHSGNFSVGRELKALTHTTIEIVGESHFLLVSYGRLPGSDPGLQRDDRRGAITKTYTLSEKRALEIAAWARIVDGELEREANSAFWAGENERATLFFPLITYIERLAGASAKWGWRLARMATASRALRVSDSQSLEQGRIASIEIGPSE